MYNSYARCETDCHNRWFEQNLTSSHDEQYVHGYGHVYRHDHDAAYLLTGNEPWWLAELYVDPFAMTLQVHSRRTPTTTSL
ncbi:hypothetical protein [Vibrio agarivorans]|uniref:hypothetical protein n=1 Tax=Vibrio agarivorans TaxID=153622 RepID=UPI0022303651|nr:hypothetical protein [Vibrio agarivorans]MDN3661017.1 hypothetical protein [Vibrio agarivorans]